MDENTKIAHVIVDITHHNVDKIFDYIVPESAEGEVYPGVRVNVPFGKGNRLISGYVVGLSDSTEFNQGKLKSVDSVIKGSIPIESQMMALAWYIKERYGSTMNMALKTVMPVKRKVSARPRKTDSWRDHADGYEKTEAVKLSEAQQKVADDIAAGFSEKDIRKRVHLIHGVTGSGKTEIYMELIDRVIKDGKEVIMLIPEIALTYQTALRFYVRFGDKVAVINSRMSAGERYECSIRARDGETGVMIGPRSALFTPFKNLGLIIIDEEHDNSYKNESVPGYHGREIAIVRALMTGASVVLGSATPSVDSYYLALKGEYILHRLNVRAKGSCLPRVEVVDMRSELANGNKSIFSQKLNMLMRDKLDKGEQIMLFINRRGYAGFISCRKCGGVIKCTHCDVSLTAHGDGSLRCHYCGHTGTIPKLCPKCGSKYIGLFGTGTEKVEEAVRKLYPGAGVLRMDMDTTSKKGEHEKILSAFANGKADILIGTQMIVKGHDFPRVTLVGVIAADLSLYASDYRASERTFQLLTQAAGRAGRGGVEGHVVIQTYNPDEFSIRAAAKQDYEMYYDKEIAYRKLMGYPPVNTMTAVVVTSKDDALAAEIAGRISDSIKLMRDKKMPDAGRDFCMIGPARAGIGKINDIYRYVLYIKADESESAGITTKVRKYIEEEFSEKKYPGAAVQFDLNPLSAY